MLLSGKVIFKRKTRAFATPFSTLPMCFPPRCLLSSLQPSASPPHHSPLNSSLQCSSKEMQFDLLCFDLDYYDTQHKIFNTDVTAIFSSLGPVHVAQY